MGRIKKTELVNLVIFTFSSYIEYRFTEIKPILEKEFGPLDYVSDALPFDKYTYYYNDEMGYKLEGKLLSFKRLIHPAEISTIKRLTNSIEESFAIDGNRKINLDPGYIHHSQFLLASTKYRANRIYIGNGIYSEITLMYLNGKFTPYNFTYANYKDEEYIKELTKIRDLYLEKRKEHI